MWICVERSALCKFYAAAATVYTAGPEFENIDLERKGTYVVSNLSSLSGILFFCFASCEPLKIRYLNLI